jgi:dipeptidyl aminopeptidase/acylaminoacyl peptidase
VTDDNVHFAHTLALIEALFHAGKRAEVVALSSTHMLADPQANRARERVQLDFFREWLSTASKN